MLVGAWVRSYPPDVFPRLWATLEEMADRDEVVCPEEVLRELEAKEDDLHAWATVRPNMFIPLDTNQMAATREILAAFPRLVGELSERNRADPFVIALAQVRSLTVVTEERGGSVNRPRIPLVCQHFGVPCIGTLDFIRTTGLSF
jgi:hypothetical protein